MKSILDLLKEEDSIVRSIERLEHDIRVLKCSLAVVKGIDIECQARDDDIDDYHRRIDETERNILSEYERLIHTQQQIQGIVMGIKL